MGSALVELRAVGTFHSCDMTGVFHHCHLHTQTNAKEWDLILSTVADSANLPFYAPGTKPSRNEDAVSILKTFFTIGRVDSL